ncbi:hypothetical protein J2776_002575 [Paraburkholderia caledonica]|uniref:Uncharacterized protein n=1 Tax=Paraburkholderia caledonica TaxID=134536 RepID=A0ABU1KY18_9BURK|nr:hypothetical protein [Paraburkholderia caledonica]
MPITGGPPGGFIVHPLKPKVTTTTQMVICRLSIMVTILTMG